MTAPRTFSITTLDAGAGWAPGGKPGGGEPIQEAGGAAGGLHHGSLHGDGKKRARL